MPAVPDFKALANPAIRTLAAYDPGHDIPSLRRGLSFAIWGTAAFGVVSGLLSLVFSLIGSLLGMSIARSSLPVPPTEHSLPQ